MTEENAFRNRDINSTGNVDGQNLGLAQGEARDQNDRIQDVPAKTTDSAQGDGRSPKSLTTDDSPVDDPTMDQVIRQTREREKRPLTTAILPVIRWSFAALFLLALASTIFFWFRSGTPGLVGGLCGLVVVGIFCQMTPTSMVLLEKMGLKGKPFISGFVMIWVFKFLAVAIIGFLVEAFLPLDKTAFAWTILVCAAVIVPINVFGVMKARIPLNPPED